MASSLGGEKRIYILVNTRGNWFFFSLWYNMQSWWGTQNSKLVDDLFLLNAVSFRDVGDHAQLNFWPFASLRKLHKRTSRNNKTLCPVESYMNKSIMNRKATCSPKRALLDHSKSMKVLNWTVITTANSQRRYYLNDTSLSFTVSKGCVYLLRTILLLYLMLAMIL